MDDLGCFFFAHADLSPDVGLKPPDQTKAPSLRIRLGPSYLGRQGAGQAQGNLVRQRPVRGDSVISCGMDFPVAKEGGQVVANFTGDIIIRAWW